MGLFDYVRCDARLPDGKPTPADLFQTKDFYDPYMEHYTITGSGRLIAHRVWRELCENKDSPIGFYIKQVQIGDEDLNWHGHLNFYSYDTHTKERRSFRAKFTDGQLVEIIQVNDDAR